MSQLAPDPTQPQWHLLGPDLMPNGYTAGTARMPLAGRVSSIAVDPSDTWHLLCGSAAGGIWESHSRGAAWAPRTDFMPTLAIGAVVFDPANPSTVYAGTGEGNAYAHQGQGVLRSSDGGTTWSLLTAGPFVGKGFFRLIVDPANSQHLLAATTGGAYESTDAGATWTQVIAGQTWDISMAPGGGPSAEVLATTASGLHSSTDAGHTWTALALPGGPTASWSRLAVSIAPSDPTVAFVFGSAGSTSPHTAYLWQRRAGTWSALATPTGLATNQDWYDWYVAAPPDTASQVYLGSVNAYRGDLAAGTWTWTCISTNTAHGDSIHTDHHAIAFDAYAPGLIYAGCDGGLFRSPDRGDTWSSLNTGLAITEVGFIALDPGNPSNVVAGNQDTGTMRYLGTSAFDNFCGGDGGDCAIDQVTPGTFIVSHYYMGLIRYSASTPGSWPSIGPKPTEPNYQSCFYAPVDMNGGTVAQAGQSVFVSRDEGTTWTEVLLPAGVVTTALHLPTSDLVYAATNKGRIFTFAYTGGAWATSPTELTCPRTANVSAILADPSTAGRIWVTISTTGGGQVFRSDDGGATWHDQTAGLPAISINSVAVDNTNSNRVWVSADVGVYQSLDAGATWKTFYQNLPNVLVGNLKFHPAARVLRAATKSRGIWEAAVDKAGSSVPPQAPNAFTVLRNTDGTLQAFGVGTNKTLYYTRQTAPDSGWSGWTSLGNIITSATAGAVNQDGRLAVFARFNNGELWYLSQTTPGGASWSQTTLGGIITGNPAAARNQNGCLEVFARGTDGSLMHNVQTTPGGTWSGWSSLGGVLTSDVAVAQDTDGRLEVFVRGNDGSLQHNAQTTPGGTWSGWARYGGTYTPDLSMAMRSDGCLQVFARGLDNAIYMLAQTTPGGTWAGQPAMGWVLTARPAVAQNANGSLLMIERGADNAYYSSTQAAPGGTWTGWATMAGTCLSNPVIAQNADGRLDVFTLGSDTALWHNPQQAPNATSWYGWQSLGGTFLTMP